MLFFSGNARKAPIANHCPVWELESRSKKEIRVKFAMAGAEDEFALVSLKHCRLVIGLACSIILISSARAAAFSRSDQPQTIQQINEGDRFQFSNPAIITDRSRDPLIYDDFMRITFLPGNVGVTTPGRPTALRAFFGSTRFYEPAISVSEIANFNGFKPNPNLDLVAMECRPQADVADPYYATWPNLAKMLIHDFGSQHYDCSPPGSAPSNIAYCLAEQYTDPPTQPVINALINALMFGQKLFQIENGNFLYDDYGIDTDNGGLGLVVKGPAVPLSAGQTLRQSVVPEYLLLNLNLADLNCRCIRVAPYDGRDKDLLSARTVWKRGRLGANGLCDSYVKRLRPANFSGATP
jgi:hypothetical protein